MRFIKRILLKILILILLVLLCIVAFYNNKGVEFNFAGFSIKEVPLFLIIFVSAIFGSIINFIIFLLYKR